MRNNHGFLLIELVISMSFAAIISFTLVNTLYRANKASVALDNTTYLFSLAALAQYQFERDITTAFAPVITMVSTEKTDQTTPGESTAEPSSLSPRDNQEKQKTEESKKIFYGTHDSNNNLVELTFITSSPLATYWSSKTGKPKARVARVVYRLVKDTQQADTYTLFRQEGQDLDFNAYTADHGDQTSKTGQMGKSSQAHNYALLKNIKQCTVTYKISIVKKPQTPTVGEKKPELAKPEVEYKTFSEWGVTEPDHRTSDYSKNEEEPLPVLPHMVTVSLTLWDKEHKREQSFNFVYSIAAEYSTEQQQITKKKQENTNPTQSPPANNKSNKIKINNKQEQPAKLTQIKRTEKQLAKTEHVSIKNIKIT